ncbi:MAG: class I SAM-dependent methyltransferase [Candidatus Omnitrophica bacterium]|nr:class I SAM-dependent methyltransferase [Candidatus Omnitrophota bacterium]
MKIIVAKGKNWFKNDFDKYYLISNYRSLFNKKILKKEIEEILSIFKKYKVSKNSRILDLHGGFGRISLELSKKGFSNIWVFDLSKYLINFGKKISSKNKLKIHYVYGNSLHLLKYFEKDFFDVVMVIANSFGYCGPQDDIKILYNIFNVLKKDGLFLLDVVLKENMPDIASKYWFSTPDNLWFILRDGRVISENLNYSLVEAKEYVFHKYRGLLKYDICNYYWYSEKYLKKLTKEIGFKFIKKIKNWLVQNKTLRSLSLRNMLVFKK